jgi:hypothetical protein
MCRQRLCKELSPRTEDNTASTDTTGSGGNSGNIDSDIRIMESAQLRGLSTLSDGQVSEETKIQEIYSSVSSKRDFRAKLLDQVSKGHDLARTVMIPLASPSPGITTSTMGDARRVVVELSSTLNIGSDNVR